MVQLNQKQIEALELQLKLLKRKERYLNFLAFLLYFFIAIFLTYILIHSYTDIYLFVFKGQKSALENEILYTVNNPVYKNMQALLGTKTAYTSSKKILKQNTNHYDLLAYVKNPNKYWYAELKYHFQFDKYKGDVQKVKIFPQENRLIWDLNVVSNINLNNFKVVFDELRWKRATKYTELKEQLDKFEITNINLFTMEEYLNTKTEEDNSDEIDLEDLEENIANSWLDESYLVDLSEEDNVEENFEDTEKRQKKKEEKNIPEYVLTFNIKNNSLYSFHEVPVMILLKSNDKLVYFYYYNILDLISDEDRKVKINLLANLSGVNKIQILPVLDIYDEENRFVK